MNRRGWVLLSTVVVAIGATVWMTKVQLRGPRLSTNRVSSDTMLSEVQAFVKSNPTVCPALQ